MFFLFNSQPFGSICALLSKIFRCCYKERSKETSIYHGNIDSVEQPEGPLIAFSAGGMLWAYYLGVIAFLRDHFDLQASGARVSGISCGVSAAFVILLDLTIEQGFEIGLQWQKVFDQRPLRFWLMSTSNILNTILKKMKKFGVDDEVLMAKYQKYSGSNTATFGVSALRLPSFRRGLWTFRDHTFHLCLSNFASVKQMIYAGTCSMRILPFFRTFGWYCGYYVLDGAFTSLYSIPDIYRNHDLHKLDGKDKVLRISVMQHKNIPVDIGPQTNFKFSDWIICGGLDVNLERFNKGYCDAAKSGNVLICTRKGLKWNCNDIEFDAIDSSEQSQSEWDAHIASKVKYWSTSITQYLTACHE